MYVAVKAVHDTRRPSEYRWITRYLQGDTSYNLPLV